MDIRFHITESEVLGAGVLHIRWLRNAALTLTVLSSLLFVVMVAFKGCCDAVLIETRLIAAVAVAVAFTTIRAVWLRFVVLPRRARRLVQKLPWLYQDASATLDEDGFVLRSPHLQINWQWAELDGFRENGAIFLLCPPASGYIIPKQRFSADQFAALDTLVRRKLKKLN